MCGCIGTHLRTYCTHILAPGQAARDASREHRLETKMDGEGDVPDNKTEGFVNLISRRNSKRAAKRQPRGDDKDGDEEGDDGGERFLLVKLQRRKVPVEAVSKGVDATSSAAAAEEPT
ncbi:uncharacterized protein LOC125531515 isoform X2 [Triticum urartu]|uniref:uncharacterized protein LOC125531515 isoform X2 n=1 Tax=Triticum urartu TaxID=4572 RepID=UPI002044C891|nr:uncharacterized protein LOC125531515 isoform X2 [Triticum urartu]